uniref:Uncharacterized protein n=1 Tax=Medicago truncatula TaxID=3880 RepID=Q2HTN0_MEDTR|nr:hypothetical protein MtrDRAFT_AC150244g31v2 [Medicago truncatula]
MSWGKMINSTSMVVGSWNDVWRMLAPPKARHLLIRRVCKGYLPMCGECLHLLKLVTF